MKILHYATLGLTLMVFAAAPVATGWSAERGDLQNGITLVAQGQDRGDRGNRNGDLKQKGQRDRGRVDRGDRGNRNGDLKQKGRRDSGGFDRGDRGDRSGDWNRKDRRDSGGFDRGDRYDRRVGQRADSSRPRPVLRRDDRNRHPGYVLDKRYHHDRYYPPRGFIVHTLPRGYVRVHHDRHDYYFLHGVWYRRATAGFVVIVPPFGVVLPILPRYYTTIWVAGIPYYYAGGVYYVWRPSMQGYVVSEPPTESKVVTESPGTDQFYVYPKNGQSADQQAQDRYECHTWAVSQTGFDPSQPAADLSESARVDKRADYRRAISACLDARGYSVK